MIMEGLDICGRGHTAQSETLINDRVKISAETYVCLKRDQVKLKVPINQVCRMISDIAKYLMVIQTDYDELKNTIIDIASRIEQKVTNQNQSDRFDNRIDKNVELVVLPKVTDQEENDVVKIHKSKRRWLTDEELDNFVRTPLAQDAMEMGLAKGKIKTAIQRNFQMTGLHFQTMEYIIEAVLGRDREYESDSDESDDSKP
jgi:hypothetical protein